MLDKIIQKRPLKFVSLFVLYDISEFEEVLKLNSEQKKVYFSEPRRSSAVKLFGVLDEEVVNKYNESLDLIKETVAESKVKNTRYLAQYKTSEILLEKVFNKDMINLKSIAESGDNGYTSAWYIAALSEFFTSENAANTDETFEEYVNDNKDHINNLLLNTPEKEKQIKIHEIIKRNFDHLYFYRSALCIIPSEKATNKNVKIMSEFTRKEYRKIVIADGMTSYSFSKLSKEFQNLLRGVESSDDTIKYESKNTLSLPTLVSKILTDCLYKVTLDDSKTFNVMEVNKNLFDVIEEVYGKVRYSENKNDGLKDRQIWFFEMLATISPKLNPLHLIGFILSLHYISRICSATENINYSNFIDGMRTAYEENSEEEFLEKFSPFIKTMTDIYVGLYTTPLGKAKDMESFVSLFENSSDFIPSEISASIHLTNKGKIYVEKKGFPTFIMDRVDS